MITVPTDGRFEVVVKPNSREQSVSQEPGTPGHLVVRLKARPRDGEANLALVRLLARELGLRQQDVSITRGHRGRHKSVHVKLPN